MIFLNKKKIIGLLVTFFVLLSSFNIVLADIVIDNNNYYNSYGYNINSYNKTKPYTSPTTKSYNTTQNNLAQSNESTNKSYNNTTSTTSVSTSDSYSNVKIYDPYNYNYGYNYHILPKSTKAVTINKTNNTTNEKSLNTENYTENNISENEKKLYEMINEERIKAGLKPLKIEEKLFKIAEIKSQDMYHNSYFSHTSPTFGNTSSLIRKEGIRYYSFGENIGRTYSVYRAHSGFMNSDGHRKNILNPKFTHVGIGIVGNYYTEVFIQKR
ncbi:CAP domain-containing protein [Caldisalinibacter kiritimatiensis]|uniref:CAP domain-containing protein n=1 Tax=Caldisalinibacter kiritimatiensis TaxID=1304284 RepID=UPI0012DCF5C1|nr:CAP domain-containing protein [Caldisalinibacter kiritimatiensis]